MPLLFPRGESSLRGMLLPDQPWKGEEKVPPSAADDEGASG